MKTAHMKRYLESVWLIAGVCWALMTDKEQRRQYEYDLGGGEIEL